MVNALSSASSHGIQWAAKKNAPVLGRAGAGAHNLQHSSEFIRGLKKCGFSLAVDDFGGGRTCFSYLKMLPAAYLED